MTRLGITLLIVVFAASARAQSLPIVVDLSEHLVAITTGFSGAQVLAFGAVDEPGDVVVVIRGPARPVTMYRKSHFLGLIWVNSTSMTFDQAPSFFAVASSRPLEEIADESTLNLYELRAEYLKGLRLPRAKGSENVRDAWKAALIRNKQRLGLYPTEPGRIGFLGNRLFRTRIDFPANVPTGAYEAQIYLFKDGREIGAQTTPLFVSKVGVEAEIFDFAHQQSALYGLIAIIVALAAGWLAHMAFRKD